MFCVSKILGSTLLDSLRNSVGATSVMVTNSVRYRYFEDKPRIIKRNYGYKDKLEVRGALPRLPTGKALPMPPYVPKDNWAAKKALHGQNDYIDILGDDERINPIKFQEHIPGWLKGFKGNEYQMLLRKRGFFGHQLAQGAPTTYAHLRKRIKYLYRFLNYNTKMSMSKKTLRR